MPNRPLERRLLAVLLTTTFSGPLHAQIAMHSTGRDITAHTAIHSGQEGTQYNADQSDSAAADGIFTNSFTEGASLHYCQVQATISQQTLRTERTLRSASPTRLRAFSSLTFSS